MKRRAFMLGGAAVAWPLAARAQQSEHVWRIGILASQSLPPLQRLVSNLHECGCVEGHNLRFLSRFMDPEARHKVVTTWELKNESDPGS